MRIPLILLVLENKKEKCCCPLARIHSILLKLANREEKHCRPLTRCKFYIKIAPLISCHHTSCGEVDYNRKFKKYLVYRIADLNLKYKKRIRDLKKFCTPTFQGKGSIFLEGGPTFSNRKMRTFSENVRIELFGINLWGSWYRKGTRFPTG